MIAAATALGAAAAACGVPRESGFEPFGAAEGPFRGLATTTTTTTTTTIPSSGPVSLTTATQAVGPRPSSTLVAVEPVQLYYVIDGELTSVSRDLARPAALRQVVAALVQGPPEGTAGTGLETLVAPELVVAVVEERGQARVDLDAELLRQFEPSEQRLLIAQLVLTLGVRPGVGQITFSSDGDLLAVPLPNRGNLLSEPGEPVSYDDYEPLLTTTPTPSTPPSSTPTSDTSTPPAAPS